MQHIKKEILANQQCYPVYPLIFYFSKMKLKKEIKDEQASTTHQNIEAHVQEHQVHIFKCAALAVVLMFMKIGNENLCANNDSVYRR